MEPCDAGCVGGNAGKVEVCCAFSDENVCDATAPTTPEYVVSDDGVGCDYMDDTLSDEVPGSGGAPYSSIDGDSAVPGDELGYTVPAVAEGYFVYGGVSSSIVSSLG